METKECTKCGFEKTINLFYKKPRGRSGVSAICKECCLIAAKKHYQANRSTLLLKHKIYKAKNKEKIKQYYQDNKEEINAKQKAYRLENKEKRRIICRNCYQKKRKESGHTKRYKPANKEEILANRRNRFRNRYRIDPKFKLNSNMSRTIRESLKGGKKGAHWESLVDYSIDDLIKHLKTTLPKGFTWNDFVSTSELHIDHIIPIAAHNFTTPKDEDFKRCWSLNNLQLLPARENMSKGASLNKKI